MSAKNVKLLRKFCTLSGRTSVFYRRLKKNFSKLPKTKREQTMDEVFDSVRTLKMQARLARVERNINAKTP